MPGGVIISGGSGALGVAFLEGLLLALPSTWEIVALFRGERSCAETLNACAGAARIRPIFCDLTDEGSVRHAQERLGSFERAVGVHIAADVSWNKPAAAMRPANVYGTMSFARLLEGTGRARQLIYVSSAFTRPEDWSYRNGYEETKAEAERRLRAEFAHLLPSTFSCSLVVGRSGTGQISRFHGIYPLLHLLEHQEVPFLVGDRNVSIDLVPLDWVRDELVLATLRACAEAEPEDVVASYGEGSLTLQALVDLARETLNAERTRQGRKLLGAIPVLAPRQYQFLRRSMKAWPVSVNQRKIGLFQAILDVYLPYLVDARRQDRRGTKTEPALPSAFFAPAIRYWLHNSRSSAAAGLAFLEAVS